MYFNNLKAVPKICAYDKQVNYYRIIKLPYFTNFSNILINKSINDKNILCDGIISVTLGKKVDLSKSICMPNSVKYLTIDTVKNVNNIKDLYLNANNIKYITFGHNFNAIVKKGFIPYGTTHVTFINYNQPFTRTSIPSTVTHLVFGWKNNNSLRLKNNIYVHNQEQAILNNAHNIPSTVLNITLSDY